MKRILYLLILFSFVIPVSVFAQLENIIVETYYISDANDATDTLGGYLEPGSVTYRIYIDLLPGYKLIKLYGDANHTLKISSTANFFNNSQDGVSFAKDMVKSRLSEGTVALDTWLTLGEATKKATKTYFGVLKTQDKSGSFVGGSNNDGGSAAIATGLLVNADSSAGIPITTSDGFDTMVVVPTGWYENGIVSISGDSTIFGSLLPDSQFISNSAYIEFTSGVRGVNPDSNQILIAQLTTKGQLSFELNIQVSDSSGNITNYIANGHDSDYTGGKDRVTSLLKYPPECGCRDANYLEYNANAGCDNLDSCKTRIVFGCMDTTACNYNPNANFNIQSLCCYPGYCKDRDISVVCPSTGNAAGRIDIYPNPAQNLFTLQSSAEQSQETKYIIYNCFGRVVKEKHLGIVSGTITQQVDISDLQAGVYMLRLFKGDSSESKVFMKD